MNALGMIEVQSIPLGVNAGDAMLKAATVNTSMFSASSMSLAFLSCPYAALIRNHTASWSGLSGGSALCLRTLRWDTPLADLHVLGDTSEANPVFEVCPPRRVFSLDNEHILS